MSTTCQVLATDMAEHMAVVSRLKSEIQKRLENHEDEVGDDPPEALRTLVMQGAIKVADIGHLYAELSVHIEWSERLEEEMWRQGDIEKDRDMKVSFLMDREKPGVTKSQPGFIDFVVRPLFETWVACFPQSDILLDRINSNYEYWKVCGERMSEEVQERGKVGVCSMHVSQAWSN
jgi:cAMP-specific phosphodiesterase 4